MADLRDALAHADQQLGQRLESLERAACPIAVHAVRCQLDVAPTASCANAPPPIRPAKLAAALLRWTATSEVEWRFAAGRAADAMPLTGAEAVAIAALANALVDDCASDVVDAVVAAATALRARPDHDPKLDPHVAILVHATHAACAATHQRHHMR